MSLLEQEKNDHVLEPTGIDRRSFVGYVLAGSTLVAAADKDIDGIRNVCRCGSYTRIREAIEQGARHMK